MEMPTANVQSMERDLKREEVSLQLLLRNYRCFNSAVAVEIRDGFTALVGANNSGKSTFLKSFYELRPIFDRLAEGPGHAMELWTGTQQNLIPQNVADHSSIFCNSNTRNMELEIFFYFGEVEPTPFILRVVVARPRLSWAVSFRFGGADVTNIESSVRRGYFTTPNRLRLPVEVVVEVVRDLANTMYCGPFRNAVNLSSNTPYYDIEVGGRFIQAWRSLKTGTQKAESEAVYRLTEQLKRVFHFNSLEINSAANELDLHVNLDGKSYNLAELGSGLAQFIVVMGNIAVKRPAYILIDEPELNLHPALQVDFLTALASNASRGVIYATHSIGLARSSSDAVYSVRKNHDGVSVKPFEATNNVAEFLGEMSFSGFRELGFNRILLVEGTSDATAIRQLLRLHRKEQQVVILPLGGSSMIRSGVLHELQEITRFQVPVFALIDSEKQSEAEALSNQRKAFVEECTMSGISCHVLTRRAFENYLPARAICEEKGGNFRALGNYESLRSHEKGWAKSDNWRIARHITLSELGGTDLGAFLSRI
jgi:ABC-type cobalamin/Fe3+-siderophores transport system ATPase subunit